MRIDNAEASPDFRCVLASTNDDHVAERDGRDENALRKQARSDYVEAVRERGGIRLAGIGAGTGHTARGFSDQALVLHKL